MARHAALTAAVVLAIMLASTFVPASAVSTKYLRTSEDEDDKQNSLPKSGPKKACNIITLDGDMLSTKTCGECSEHCLTLQDCEYVSWGDMDPIAQLHLANTTMCEYPGPGEDGEEMCILLSEGNEYILDASPKDCDDCIKACLSQPECATMGWNMTLVDEDDLNAYECPAFFAEYWGYGLAPAPAPLGLGLSMSVDEDDEDEEEKDRRDAEEDDEIELKKKAAAEAKKKAEEKLMADAKRRAEENEDDL